MLDVRKSNRIFRLTMSASLENIDEADDCLAAYLKEMRLPVELFVVRILLRESLLNAVTHGSDSDPTKSVSLVCKHNKTKLTIQVTDSGPGFPWKEQEVYSHNLDEGGRGLELMKIYADGLEYNRKGNQITLTKNYSSVIPTL